MDNRIVKASFRECPLSDRKLFKDSSCLMPISVGQSIHEGGKFIATIKLVKSSFQKCTILVDDTVQRHTLKIENPQESDDFLYQAALLGGDDWLARNIPAISALGISFEVQRWNSWLNHPKFNEQLNKIKNLYDTNVIFRKEITLNIREYLERDIREMSSDYSEDSHAFKCCLTYLQEECAVMTLWVEGGYNFEVYLSGRNRAMAATYKHLIEPSYPNLLRPVSLRFKKYLDLTK